MSYWIGALGIMVLAWFLLGFVISRRTSRVVCLLALAGLMILIPRPNPVPTAVVASPDNFSGPGVDLSGELLTMEGKTVSLADDRGKVLFLNFWATWCGPCRAEMPAMETLYDLLREDGLSMVAITEEPKELVSRYLDQHPYPFQIMIDPKGELTRRLQVVGLPTTFVLDKKRRIIYSQVGAVEWDAPEVISLFRRALEE